MNEGLKKITGILGRALFGGLGALAGYQLLTPVLYDHIPERFFVRLLAGGLAAAGCGVIGVIVAPFFIRLARIMSQSIEQQLKESTWSEISSSLAGLLIGLVLANLLVMPFSTTPFGPYISVIMNALIGFMMARLFEAREADIRAAMASMRGIISQKLKSSSGRQGRHADLSDELWSEEVPHKILDSSVLIDGRILDIARTGFLQGTLVLPTFVVHELQLVADSRDSGKRARGRLGLDLADQLQKLKDVRLIIVDEPLSDYGTTLVDDGVLAMAQKYGCDVLTTDYNLNKVAQLKHVRVLNVNELSNALKPTLLPGDRTMVNILKEGKDPCQGIGYLENGTMLVVEDGGDSIGETVEVTVTSTLQTSAGRMIFGRIRMNREGKH